jgi:NlpC/P60 family putative phage cell wall peptidase
MKPEDYIAAARRWINTPFRHQGCRRQAAADCLGLVYGAARDIGIPLEALPAYAPQPAAEALERGLQECPALEQTRTPGPGDILVFRFARDLQHVGILTGANIIHAYQPLGKCVEHRFCSKWKARQLMAFRIKALHEQ